MESNHFMSRTMYVSCVSSYFNIFRFRNSDSGAPSLSSIKCLETISISLAWDSSKHQLFRCYINKAKLNWMLFTAIDMFFKLHVTFTHGIALAGLSFVLFWAKLAHRRFHCASHSLGESPRVAHLSGRVCLRSLIFQKCISLHTALTAKTNT